MNNYGPLEIGSVGIAVNKMQGYLNIFQQRGIIRTKVREDGKYGLDTAQAVREFQTHAGIPADGKIGLITWNKIVDEIRSLNIVTNIPVWSKSYYLGEGDYGLAVFKMQEYLNEIAARNSCLRPIPADAEFGPVTKTAVQQFQYLYDLKIDGMIGKATWDAIVNERNAMTR